MKKTNLDLAHGWLRKAASDLRAAELCLQMGESLDVACFHCQQTAEKALKAWLTHRQGEFPHIHDLERLVALCSALDADFQKLATAAGALNPYAVDMRYEESFWPDANYLQPLLNQARSVFDLVSQKLPPLPAQS
jgi:HEPN domain-containing protein